MSPAGRERPNVAVAAGTIDYAEALARLVPTERSTQRDLLPLLHALQDMYGYIDDKLVPHIAEALNLSRAEVHGVVTFYHDFRRTPPGRHIVKICRAESCRSRGAMAIERAIVESTGVAVGSSSPDGALTIDRMHCFGLCAIGPNVMVDGQIRSRVDDRVLPGLIAQIRT